MNCLSDGEYWQRGEYCTVSELHAEKVVKKKEVKTILKLRTLSGELTLLIMKCITVFGIKSLMVL